MLKLSMSISKPGLTLPATRLSNSFSRYADRGPRTKAPRIITCPPNGSTDVPSASVDRVGARDDRAEGGDRADDRAALAVDHLAAGVGDQGRDEDDDHRAHHLGQVRVGGPAVRDEQRGDEAERDERPDVGHHHAREVAAEPLDACARIRPGCGGREVGHELPLFLQPWRAWVGSFTSSSVSRTRRAVGTGSCGRAGAPRCGGSGPGPASGCREGPTAAAAQASPSASAAGAVGSGGEVAGQQGIARADRAARLGDVRVAADDAVLRHQQGAVGAEAHQHVPGPLGTQDLGGLDSLADRPQRRIRRPRRAPHGWA